MKRIWFTCLTSVVWGLAGVAIAQETSIPIDATTPITTSNPLQGTIPVNSNILGNGVQFNNGFSGSPNCNQRVCGYIQYKTSPSGNESTVGLTLQIGGSSDDTRAEAEKARVEIDRIKNERDFKIQLMEKIATAIEANNCTRARIFSQELATISGYKNHWDYLKDIDARLCMR